MKNTGSVDINYDYKCQLIVIGDSTVGKTSLLFQYNNQSNPLKQVATVGIDYFTKDVLINGKIVRTKIWDTAGQERYQSLGTAFYRGADCCLLVYDLTNKDSFENIMNWKTTFLQKSMVTQPDSFPFLVVANKLDLEQEQR